MDEKIMVTRSSMPPFEEYEQEIKSIWESRWLTNSGVKHQELEKNLCEYLGVENLALCVNGHQALEAIVEVLDLKGEVITTPFTFTSTTNSIVRKGLKPVFCDIRPDDFTIDADKIEALITEKTSAIMPVHVYGNICEYEKIQKIADKYGLKVIYDAAHAFGATVDGIGAGALGDASMFSFHATKVFHTIEGGCAIFKDKKYYDKLNQFKNFGLASDGGIDFAGSNIKMNEFAAAMGLCNLRHIDESIASRKEAVERYRENLSGVRGIQLSAVQDNVKSNYAYFPIIVNEEFRKTRDNVFSVLADNNIIARKYFYPLTSQIKAFNGAYPETDTPVAERISKSVLCLPLYEGLSKETVDRICNVIKSSN